MIGEIEGIKIYVNDGTYTKYKKTLEDEIDELQQENQELKKENKQLKERIERLKQSLLEKEIKDNIELLNNIDKVIQLKNELKKVESDE